MEVIYKTYKEGYKSPTLLSWKSAGPGKIKGTYQDFVFTITFPYDPGEEQVFRVEGYSGVLRSKKVAKEVCEDLLARRLAKIQEPKPKKKRAKK